MLYFPKSQIQTNQYSNGDLHVKYTQETYVGFYWGTSTGRYFAGKSPDSVSSTIELIKPGEGSNVRQNEPDYDSEESKTRIFYGSPDVTNYLKLNSDIDPNNLPQVPIYISPIPTKEDYENQEYTRYFCKKDNESFYLEIDQDTYTKLVEESEELDFRSYIPFSIPWVLVGEQEKVALENKNAVDYAIFKYGARGFAKYLKSNYTLHYNITPGITKRNSKRVYSDNGVEVPSNLPEGYRLEKGNQACTSCAYNKGGSCTKWSAPIRANYYCNLYKASTITPEEEAQNFLREFSSSTSTDIYNQSDNTI